MDVQSRVIMALAEYRHLCHSGPGEARERVAGHPLGCLDTAVWVTSRLTLCFQIPGGLNTEQDKCT
jgi:hypothetical protein